MKKKFQISESKKKNKKNIEVSFSRKQQKQQQKFNNNNNSIIHSNSIQSLYLCHWKLKKTKKTYIPVIMIDVMCCDEIVSKQQNPP